MLKRFLSVVLIVFLLSVPAFAASNDVYELEPDAVEAPTMLSLAAGTIAPLAATSWDTSDQSNLSAIRNAFYNPNTGYVSNSLLGWVKKLADNYQPSPFDSDSVLELTQIKSAAVVNLPYLQNISTYISNLDMVDDILNKVGLIELDTSSIDTILSSLYSAFTSSYRGNYINSDGNSSYMLEDFFDYVGQISVVLSRPGQDDTGYTTLYSHIRNLTNFVTGYYKINYTNRGNGSSAYLDVRLPDYITRIWLNLTRDAVDANGYRTLYSRIYQLQEVLASDDDLALAKSQEANREQVEESFLSGSSGDTSLGASDFGALSDIGGSFKDTVSLNGQSSISDLTDGLASADESGRGWFSTSTKDALDTVSSAASYSLRNDPYNMAGWEQRYAWLNGG